MGVLQTIRARFPNTHVTLRNTVDSEETLMSSPDSSRSRRIKHYVKERGKSAGACVLKKLAKIIVDRGVDASNVSYGQPGAATQVQPSNPDDRYIDIRHLGSGGNGSVHLYRDRQMHILVAIKTIYHDANTPPNEALVLNYLGLHENVIQLYTTLTHPSRSLVPRTRLRILSRRRPRRLYIYLRRTLFRDISLAPLQAHLQRLGLPTQARSRTRGYQTREYPLNHATLRLNLPASQDRRLRVCRHPPLSRYTNVPWRNPGFPSPRSSIPTRSRSGYLGPGVYNPRNGDGPLATSASGTASGFECGLVVGQ
jgi:hypothetical protein